MGWWSPVPWSLVLNYHRGLPHDVSPDLWILETPNFPHVYETEGNVINCTFHGIPVPKMEFQRCKTRILCLPR